MRDHLGSIRELTDSTGAVRARYDYDPYGKRTKLSGDLDAQFGFTGFYYHARSGLNLALYRAYDFSTGRWLSRDPIGEEAGTNLYNYVANDPMMKIDRLGLDATNNSSAPIFVLKDGVWYVLPPGQTLTGETGAFSNGLDPATGKASAFKWIDCYDVKVLDPDPNHPNILNHSIDLIWVGNQNTSGKSWKRKVACAFPGIAASEQNKRGGVKPDAKIEFGSNPPARP